MDDLLTVETAQGRLSGIREGGARAWKGIPYAAPPVGTRRFRHSVPGKPWPGLRDASQYGPASMQDPRRSVERMDEDSLTLNVWAPYTEEKNKPVLVFVHGGSFSSGSGASADINGADLAASGDVVVVTLNYRLGVLGFVDFSFLGDEFEPNCGLSDVVQALRWVKENAESFGGDPQNVTLFGQSAGGTVTSLLPVMPQAAGLAARGICMSAGPTLPFSKEKAKEVAVSFLRFRHADKDRLLSLSAQELMDGQKEFRTFCGLGAGTFQPVIDGRLVTDYPVAAAAKGEARPVPLLMGTCREEMSFLYVKPVANALEISGIFEAGAEAEDEQAKKRIAESYDRYGKRGPAIMMSDLVFRMGSVWLAEAMSPHADVWMYRFDYETPAMKVSNLHSFHSSDIPFVFGNHKSGMAPLMFIFSPSKREIRRITKEMREDFLTFARDGKLPWERCSGTNTPAKCYGKTSLVEPAVEPEVKEAYIGSNFHTRSFAGEDNNLHRS